ncbi:MAG: CHC2 zinc finger domain-containing protein [Fastidiosipilaceae bacterium]|jgi:DNA primase
MKRLDAKEIATQITAHDIAKRLGVKINNRGYCCCPFHEEKTASLKFYENGTWHCFGCGKGGNSVTFVMLFYNLSCPKACKWIQRTLGIGEEMSESEWMLIRLEREKKREQKTKYKREIDKRYLESCKRLLMLERIIDTSKIGSSDWVIALHERTSVEIQLDELTDNLLAVN